MSKLFSVNTGADFAEAVSQVKALHVYDFDNTRMHSIRCYGKVAGH